MTFRPIRSPTVAALAAALLALGGCAGVPQAQIDVAGYGAWPAGRSAGSYRFERLPSQQQAGAAQDEVERAAAAALARAGFHGIQPGSSDDTELIVQAGLRSYRVVDPMQQPMWYGGHPWGVRGWWGTGGAGLGLGWTSGPPRDVQEAVLLLIDHRTRQVLYEGRARADQPASPEVLQALYAATLEGFPQLHAGTRQITVPLGPEAAASAPAAAASAPVSPAR